MTLPNPITVVVRLTNGRGARMPVPVSVVVLTAAAFSALLVKIIWAVFAPVVVGVNVIVTSVSFQGPTSSDIPIFTRAF